MRVAGIPPDVDHKQAAEGFEQRIRDCQTSGSAGFHPELPPESAGTETVPLKKMRDVAN